MNRDEDDDTRRTFPIWCGGIFCCFGLAALIWLIVLQVQVNHQEDRLNRLISNCNGVCPANGIGSGTVTSSHGGGVRAASFKKARNSGALQPVPLPKKSKSGSQKPPPKPVGAGEEELPADATPRWSRVGDAKKPTK
jgi:hypothetical protein